MKTTLSYILTAGNAIRDTITQKYSFIDVFNVIAIPKDLEFVIQSFYVCGKINDVPAGDSNLELKIVDSSSNVISTIFLTGKLIEGPLDFAGRFFTLKLEKEGKYYLKASLNGQDLEDGNKFFFRVTKQKV